MYDLSHIADTVQKYAKITSEIANVDVEVVDVNLIRVAGTGIFSESINTDVSENSHVYKHAIKTGERQIVYEPGKDARCKNCKLRNECNETFEISMPINMKGEIIGVIGMGTSDEESRQLLISNLNNYLEFLEEIADFIATKASEDEDAKSKMAMVGMLKIIIQSMDEGAIIINNDGYIDTINPSAKKQLGITRMIYNEKIYITATGDTVNNSK